MNRSTTRRLLRPAALGLALALGPLLVGGPQALAATGTGNQQTLITVQAGVLTVSSNQPTVTLPGTTPGTVTSANVGTLSFTNTVGDGSAWGITAAVTDMTSASSLTSCAPANCIPFGAQAMTTNQAAFPLTGSGGNSTTGMIDSCTGYRPPSNFSGSSDSTPGVTFSDPKDILTGATSANQGSYTMTDCKMSLSVPINTAAGNYSGTLQYTITG